MANALAAAILVLSLEIIMNELPPPTRTPIAAVVVAAATAALLLFNDTTKNEATRANAMRVDDSHHAASTTTPTPTPMRLTAPTPMPPPAPLSPTPPYTHAACMTAGAAAGLSAAELAPGVRKMMLALAMAACVTSMYLAAEQACRRRSGTTCRWSCGRRTPARSPQVPTDEGDERRRAYEARIAAAVPLPDSDDEL